MSSINMNEIEKTFTEASFILTKMKNKPKIFLCANTSRYICTCITEWLGPTCIALQNNLF